MGWLRFAVVTASFLLPTGPAVATVWFFADNEEGIVGANSPSSPQGPYFWEYMSPGRPIRDESVKYANDTPRRNGGKYMEISTWAQTYPEDCALNRTTVVQLQTSLCSYYWQSWNPNGAYGEAFSEANPLNQKVQDASVTQIQRLQGGGTVAQPDYDAPPHKMQFDGLTFTDDLALLQARGYFSDPDPGGTSNPRPLAPQNLRLNL